MLASNRTTEHVEGGRATTISAARMNMANAVDAGNEHITAIKNARVCRRGALKHNNSNALSPLAEHAGAR